VENGVFDRSQRGMPATRIIPENCSQIHIPVKLDHCITAWELSETECSGKPEVIHHHTRTQLHDICAKGLKDADGET
jgi:hypothetical protein